MSKTNSLYMNRPQMLVQAVQAATTVAILPRGGGKSSGVGPNWFRHRVTLMPGGASAIVGATYKQLLSRTLPPFLSTLKKMSLVEGVHFVVGTRPPKFWEAEPLVPPKEFKDTILWCNGHVTYLVSQDRPGSPNSLSIQFAMIDEARFLNKERFDEDFVPTLRGNKDLFGNLPEYCSMLFMTDQPTSASARWIFDYEKLHNQKLITALVNLNKEIQEHQRQLDHDDLKPTKREELRRSHNNLKKMYDRMRKDSVLFIEGTVMDNVNILGFDAIRRMKRTMNRLMFEVAILGKRMRKVIGSFYPDLDEDKHTYDSKYNYKYLDSIDERAGDSPDWRQDLDLIQSMPLRIGSDHGASYNGFVIGQPTGSKLRVVNNIYVLNPETTIDLVHKFAEYYKGFPSNEVWFYYDHTHIAESGKALNITFKDEVCDTLSKLGWNVVPIYIGHTPNPTDRFNLAIDSMRGKPGRPQVSFNRDKTEILRMAMFDTKAKAGRKENTIVKDKSDERNVKISQDRTTHGPDAFDILLWGVANPDDSQIDQQEVLPPIGSN